MAERPHISVIVPAYNAEEYLTRAVDSILMQDYMSVEVIIVDDGSTDATLAVCEELSSHDSRVRVIHKENGGVGSARNAGLDVARGEYVMFLDADDGMRDGSLELMGRYNADMVMAGFAKVHGSSIIESHKPHRTFFYEGEAGMTRFFDRNIGKKNCYLLNSACFKLYKRHIIELNHLRFDLQLNYGEDKMFVFSYLRYAESVATVSEVVYDYMIQPQSLSSDVISDTHLKQIMMLLEKYVPVLGELEDKYDGSSRLERLYHVDVVGRYVARILTSFAMYKSELRSTDNIRLMYDYMDKDDSLGLFSVRMGQIPNILLYKIGKPKFTSVFYRMTSSIASLFRKKK
jgi:glycosyltransferase involved in cell wall biosynthesis